MATNSTKMPWAVWDASGPGLYWGPTDPVAQANPANPARVGAVWIDTSVLPPVVRARVSNIVSGVDVGAWNPA